ncbi:hypothetical protein SADUNF_Sadunf19G0080200 [Salix dunnii]|uniref:Fatty acyl-CoA reductase n=1 Tax=Salix dunnii TaxID=1413687 RepID=A0A835J2M5_9ROSI|nr:hypothetical protein SADUNF_Sadunf19G0080200 [Salix dunnii]
MELGSIVEFLNSKSILVIGATGFLAKIFVEKILRVQPEVKKLYLLLRAVDTKSAEERLHNEWDYLYLSLYMHGTIHAKCLCTALYSCVHVCVCMYILPRTHIEVTFFSLFVFSSAYVCGEDGGLIKENPFRLGTAKISTKLIDIGKEKKLVEEKLRNLHSVHAEESAITSYMKNYSSKRARMHGWPNTYVFTKAMGEMLLVHHNRGTVPLVILRPTMVTSTYHEPFPGWIEGVRTIDGVAVGYAKGKLKAFPFNPKLTVDVIPADMVINALTMAMVEHANRSTISEIIYHVGSSLRNPFKFSNFKELCIRYFVHNPLIDKDGKSIKVGKLTAFSSMASFRIYMAIRYSLALKVFHLAINTVLFQKSYKDKYIALERNLKRGMRMAELYEPYVFFKGIFDDANSEKLQRAATKTCSEAYAFNFDLTSINWEAYMMDAHFPGLVKHVLK